MLRVIRTTIGREKRGALGRGGAGRGEGGTERKRDFLLCVMY